MLNSRRECPVCGTTGERRVLHQQRFAGDGVLGSGYDVVVCGACGAAFADGIPPQAELDRYYAEQSKYEYAHNDGAESPYDIKRFEAIVDQIIPFFPSREIAILDVGCATGGLLGCLARRGYKDVLGSDPSPACAKAARRLHGVEVVTATIAELAALKRRFDLILVVGVLEHLRDVRVAVSSLTTLLNAGGALYCAQPDVEAFADCANAPYQQFSTEHVNFFSTASLDRLMATCGLAPRHTWRWMIEWREGMTDSVVSGIYVRTTTAPAVGTDDQTAPALARYLALCRKEDEKIRLMIEALVASQEPILVWGAGTLTRRLLATAGLAEANIVAFVDSNARLRHQRLANLPILAPESVARHNESILICSKPFEREIITTIRDQLRLSNRLILLS